MPRPNRRLVWMLLAGTLPAAFATLSPGFLLLTVIIDLCAVGLFAFDSWLARNDPAILVRRDLPQRVSRRTPFKVAFEASNGTARLVNLSMVDRLPESFEPRELRRVLTLEATQHLQSHHTVVAMRRGVFDIAAPTTERPTPLGLGTVRVPTEGAVQVSVLPDTQALGQFDALVRQRRLHEMGVARVRQRGEGTEIAGLRLYAAGDPYARVDWKATARRTTLVTREMHTERRQNVVLLLDCGRRMARESDGRSRLDHAVEAALLLSHVALRSDDRVGLAAFADRMLRVVPPVRGLVGARGLTEAMFSLEPVLREPPYEKVAAQASRHFPRRSLMVFFTDAVEPTSLESLVKPVRFLSRRHLVLCVVFEDAAIDRAVNQPLENNRAFYQVGAASELAVERERGLRRLRNAGALVLESPVGALSTRVINRYLEVKARRFL